MNIENTSENESNSVFDKKSSSSLTNTVANITELVAYNENEEKIVCLSLPKNSSNEANNLSNYKFLFKYFLNERQSVTKSVNFYFN